MKKVFMAIGNKELEELIKAVEGIDVIENEPNLETVYNLIEFMSVDILIINRLLNQEGDLFIKIAEMAKSKNINVIMLVHETESYEEKKLVTDLVARDVYVFLNIKDLTAEAIKESIMYYPEKFDFKYLAKGEIERVVEKDEKIIITNQRTAAFWGYTGGMGSSTNAYNYALGCSKNSKVALLDWEEISGNIAALADVPITNVDKIINLIDRNELTLPLLKKELKQKGNMLIMTGINMSVYYKIKEEHLITILKMLKREYPLIVICAGNGICTSGVHAAMNEADKIVAVTDARKTDVIGTLDTIDFIDKQWDIHKDKFNIVLNKEGFTSELDKAAAQEYCENYGVIIYGSVGNKISKIYEKLKNIMIPESQVIKV